MAKQGYLHLIGSLEPGIQEGTYRGTINGMEVELHPAQTGAREHRVHAFAVLETKKRPPNLKT